jgi:hypothetical protein
MKPTQKQIKEFKNFNSLFIYQHGYDEKDVIKYFEVKQKIEARNKNITDGDILEVWSNNKYVFYKEAHIEIGTYAKNQFSYCEDPMIPFINPDNLRTSASGGSWQIVPKDTYFLRKEHKLFSVWGHCGACAGGAFNINAKVNRFKTVIDREYIPYAIYARKQDKKSDYKYFLYGYNKKQFCQTAFCTTKGLKDYLRQRNLKIGKKIREYSNEHKIIGDFNTISILDKSKFEQFKLDFKVFPIMNNGNYTEAVFNPNTKEVFYLNCNIPQIKMEYIHP